MDGHSEDASEEFSRLILSIIVLGAFTFFLTSRSSTGQAPETKGQG